jgi:transcriptional regulator of acetoin/glycerol metabolism
VALGLDAGRPLRQDIASAAELRSEWERHGLVRGMALAEMETLHQQIAGSNFLIAFAAPDGLLLDIVADKTITDAPEGKSIRAGSRWNEQSAGTNGIGTAAFCKRPVVVHGDEHFFLNYRSLTCCAAPVFAPEGTLAGVLDASSDCVSRQSHTQALVEMSATQISNGLFRERHRRDIVVAFHNRGEFLRTLSAGLIALDERDDILATNQAARAHLHGIAARARAAVRGGVSHPLRRLHVRGAAPRAASIAGSRRQQFRRDDREPAGFADAARGVGLTSSRSTWRWRPRSVNARPRRAGRAEIDGPDRVDCDGTRFVGVGDRD